MTLWQRLTNLWALSAWEIPPMETKEWPKGTEIARALGKPPLKRMAIIIEPKNDFLDEIPTDQPTSGSETN